MIVWNTMVEKADKVLKAVNNELAIKGIKIDGVVEPFNNGREKGMVLKIYDSYNPEIDLCIWVYLPKNRLTNNEMNILVGHHCDCLSCDAWNKVLPSKTISNKVARAMHNEAREYITNVIEDYLNKNLNVSLNI